jgi:hypothetical protein
LSLRLNLLLRRSDLKKGLVHLFVLLMNVGNEVLFLEFGLFVLGDGFSEVGFVLHACLNDLGELYLVLLLKTVDFSPYHLVMSLSLDDILLSEIFLDSK